MRHTPPPPSNGLLLLDVEPRGLHGDGQREVLLQLLLRRVQRQVDPVKACVRPREGPLRQRPAGDREEANVPVVPLQRAEALAGHAAGAGHELEQPRTALLVELLFDDLPEPLDDLMLRALGLVLPLVDRVRLPVRHVDLGQAAHEDLELLEVEDAQERARDDVVEALQQRAELLLRALRHAVADLALEVEPHVLVREAHVPSIGHERHRLVGA
mmetsp:Transcript_21682/g.66385  ORF Transcript_21682/g.66385 Transcript_21682/m.66385 type:complete len:214 (-) Transcript_21682:731-1372(-)